MSTQQPIMRFSGETVASLMKAQGRGPAWVGRQIGRSRSYVHSLRTGAIRNPPGHTVILLARTLHVQADALFDSPPVQSDPAPGDEEGG